jgi:GWxTD domain-containing protein
MRLHLISIFLFFCCNLFAIQSAISYATFKGNPNYIEMYYAFTSNTLKSKLNEDKKESYSINLTIIFSQNNKVINYDKYQLKGIQDVALPILLEQKRYKLDNGTYEIEINLLDNNDTTNHAKDVFGVTMNYNSDSIQLSDIQLLSQYKKDSSTSNFVKNNLYLETLPFDYYSKVYSELKLYHEVYNSKVLNDGYLITYSIAKTDDPQRPVLKIHKRKNPEEVSANLVKMDISKLESGNYNLLVYISNRKNEILSTRLLQFQRSNPLLNFEENKDSLTTEDRLMTEFVGELDSAKLKYSLRAIMIFLPHDETEWCSALISKNDMMAQRRFLFRYWAKNYPINPRIAFEQYTLLAKKVDLKYKDGFGYGFETDRGRIFMKYGEPSDVITEEQEPSAPPYQIWVYNVIEKTNQKNVKFLFYNPNLITNGYRLLHSTARGELNNPKWVQELYKGSPSELTGSSIDGRQIGKGNNRKAQEYFNDF